MKIITIDGKASSGKGTLSEALSLSLGIPHLDNGKIFRAVAFINFNELTNSSLIDPVNLINTSDFEVSFDGEMKIWFQNKDITEFLISPEVSKMTSLLASDPKCFLALVDKVRAIAYDLNSDFISDGRAVGTHIFPEANVKFFIDAPVEIRAERRFSDFKAAGVETTYERVLQDLLERDHLDLTRELAPLTIPRNAIVIDTYEYSIEELVEKMKKIILGPNELSEIKIN